MSPQVEDAGVGRNGCHECNLARLETAPAVVVAAGQVERDLLGQDVQTDGYVGIAENFLVAGEVGQPHGQDRVVVLLEHVDHLRDRLLGDVCVQAHEQRHVVHVPEVGPNLRDPVGELRVDVPVGVVRRHAERVLRPLLQRAETYGAVPVHFDSHLTRQLLRPPHVPGGEVDEPDPGVGAGFDQRLDLSARPHGRAEHAEEDLIPHEAPEAVARRVRVGSRVVEQIDVRPGPA
mmetsp:Transcript_18181/g.40398  ORF Transcript_18181/g.40398 Transcript_18181/m.40398 type:complete len:233 (+) Transcript_18181:911-1609(+)